MTRECCYVGEVLRRVSVARSGVFRKVADKDWTRNAPVETTTSLTTDLPIRNHSWSNDERNPPDGMDSMARKVGAIKIALRHSKTEPSRIS